MPSDLRRLNDGVMRKWIVATVVLAVAVVGAGAYALSLRSDGEGKDAQIAAQQEQLADQQGVADDVRDAAAMTDIEALNASCSETLGS